MAQNPYVGKFGHGGNKDIPAIAPGPKTHKKNTIKKGKDLRTGKSK